MLCARKIGKADSGTIMAAGAIVAGTSGVTMPFKSSSLTAQNTRR
jgi:hypothetical protein